MTMMMHGIQLTQQAPTGQENSLPTPMDGFVDSLMRWSFITDQPLIIDSDVVEVYEVFPDTTKLQLMDWLTTKNIFIVLDSP